MGVAVAGTGGGVADVDHADLDVFHSDAGALTVFAAGSLLIVAVAAAGQQSGHQGNGANKSENFFHV